MFKKFLIVLRKSGISNKNESWPLSDVISANPTFFPIEFNAITISRFSDVGYNQSEVKDIMKNFVLDFSNAFERFPLNCFVRSN